MGALAAGARGRLGLDSPARRSDALGMRPMPALAPAPLAHAPLLALLVFFRAESVRLVPAGIAMIRDRSTRGEPERRLALLLLISVVPAASVGAIFNDFVERQVRAPGPVALMLVAGAVILRLADRWGSRIREIDQLTPTAAFGIGIAQALGLVPAISRSGVSIAAGLFARLTREAAARFSFLMATPVIADAGVFEARRLLTDETGVTIQPGVLAAGVATASWSGLLAIRFMLGYLRGHSTNGFVAYRIAIAVAVVLWLLGVPWK